MKFLILTDHFGNGGAERVASLIINGLAQVENNEVQVCIFENQMNYNLDLSKIKIYLLTPKNYGYIINILLRIKKLAEILRQERPVVVFSFGPIMASYVYIAKKLSGVKNIKVIDSERNDPRYEPVSDRKKNLRDFCYRRANILVCQTPMAIDLLKRRNINTQYVIIPNPISPNLPTWLGVNSKNIITAARLTEQKNLPLMIDAFQKIHREFSEYRLIIYGDGDLRPQLESIIRQKKLHDCIFLPGFTSDIHSIMAKSYMYVSSSDYEGISNSMLESLGIGLPCVCTDCPVGGARMYIKNGKNGFLTSVGNLDSLYQAMRSLICDKQLAQEFSKESQKIKGELSLEKITQMWIDLVVMENFI